MIKTVQELLDSLYAKGKRGDIISIESTSTTQEAAALMNREKVNLLAVTDRGGVYIGVISTSDTSAILGSSLRPSERAQRLVLEIMSKDVITASTEDSLMDIPRKFEKIRHLVVVNSRGEWVAILDSNEVMSAVMANIEEDEALLKWLAAEDRRHD